ncbi:MAG: DUF504 domain-containing protein [Candidatus Hadarchaeota archaeon]
MGARKVLNKLKWHPERSLDDSEITIEHRGAPRNELVLSGEEIEDLGSGFMEVRREGESVMIPYHRILKIKTSDGVLWRKKA